MKIGNIKCYGIIYKITNKVNGKVYIGQTIQNFKRRYRNGIIDTHNEYLKKSIEKYGVENFEIIEKYDIAFSKQELDIKEIMYIKLYNSTNPKYGYNFREGGSNGIFNDETRKKMSEANKGKNNPMYGKYGENNPNYGRHHSEETRKKISEAQKGKPSKRKGTKLSEETKRKVSENNAWKGKKRPEHSEEMKGIKNKNAKMYKVIDINGNEKIMCGNEIYNHHSQGFLNISKLAFEKYIKPYNVINILNIKKDGRTKDLIEKLKPFNGWEIKELN